MYDKWQVKKPKKTGSFSNDIAKETSAAVKEMQLSWGELNEKIQRLIGDATHVGKQPPKMEYYEQMKGEIAEAIETWGLFDEYKAEIEVHAQEEWPTYRKKAYFAFQDFFLKWIERLRQRESDIRNGLKEGDIAVVRFLL